MLGAVLGMGMGASQDAKCLVSLLPGDRGSEELNGDGEEGIGSDQRP